MYLFRSDLLKLAEIEKVNEFQTLRFLKIVNPEREIFIIEDTDKPEYSFAFIKLMKEELDFKYISKGRIFQKDAKRN